MRSTFCHIMAKITLVLASLCIAAGVIVLFLYFAELLISWLYSIYLFAAGLGGLVISAVLHILDEIADLLFSIDDHIKNPR